MLDVNLKQENI